MNQPGPIQIPADRPEWGEPEGFSRAGTFPENLSGRKRRLNDLTLAEKEWPKQTISIGGVEMANCVMEKSYVTFSSLLREQIPIIVAAFAAIGWNKPASLFETYWDQAQAGEREVWLAYLHGQFAGYIGLKWSSDYAPFRMASVSSDRMPSHGGSCDQTGLNHADLAIGPDQANQCTFIAKKTFENGISGTSQDPEAVEAAASLGGQSRSEFSFPQGGGCRGNLSTPQDTIKGGIPEIVDLNVLPHARNRGIGTALMEKAEEAAAQRSDQVGLAVGLYGGSDGGYGPAQRLYVQRGYLPDGGGATYQGVPALPGVPYPLDDHLVLWMTKKLSHSGAPS